MKLIFIYGMPATGKYTVARELASITGYKLFHNHLVIDCLLPVFDFGSKPFVEVRERIWLSVFDQACRSRTAGLIFTFAPERTVRPEFITQALKVVSCAGSEIVFIELVCPLDELKIRLGHASRQQYRKLTSLPLFEQLHADGTFDSSYMPEPRLRIDTSLCNPGRAALRIVQKLELATGETGSPKLPGIDRGNQIGADTVSISMMRAEQTR